MRSYRSVMLGAALGLAAAAAAHADPAPFDLAGPSIELEVTRGAMTLPASQVPNLAAGDRVWMKADLPTVQSAHYLMVAAFLRGSTNPPAANWFSRCQTWVGKCSQDGMTLTVPKDAQQLLVFLAPETGGDFNTLVNAVRGRPGAFVRTSQDLNQATLDRSRLQSYLDAIRSLGEADPARLKEAAPLVARSLAIKVDEKCLDKIALLQASCLLQGRESLILNDGHSVTIAQALTSGPASSLAMEASSTPLLLRSGNYGPFVGSVLDIARIMDSIRTAQYQYIPALASARGRQLTLTLNAPPSFHDPKSVLVVGLPAVEAPQFPPLHPVDPKEMHCARKDTLILPVEGAPLVFSTAYAHDLALRLSARDGTTVDLPARAEAERGGFAVDTSALRNVSLGDTMRASLHGYWGFDKYEGPSFQLVDAREQPWRLAAGDEAALIIGRTDTVHLRAGSVGCIEAIALKDPAGKELKLVWKSVKPDEVEIELPLQETTPGEMTLLVRQFGNSEPQSLPLRTFAEAGHLDRFAGHAGDSQGVLRGNRLDEVDSLVLKGVEFVPGALSTIAGRDELSMLARTADAASVLSEGETAKARVTFKDGRAFDVGVSVDGPRPSATLIGKSAQLAPSGSNGNIRLSNPDELPQDAQLTFSLRAQSPSSFTRDEKIEVATTDGSWSTLLGAGAGGMTLENSKVAVATLDPAKAFGSSAFGPLRFRMVSNGVAGDWRPLATLVRLPVLKSLECPATLEVDCKLSGVNLFLLDSVSGDPQFTQPVQVPDGFPGRALPVPRPTEGQLYVKLRDDPSVISVAVLDVRPPPSEVQQPQPQSKPPSDPQLR
jgi:hypothetical protein